MKCMLQSHLKSLNYIIWHTLRCVRHVSLCIISIQYLAFASVKKIKWTSALDVLLSHTVLEVSASIFWFMV